MFLKNKNEGWIKRLEEKIQMLAGNAEGESRQLEEMNRNIGKLKMEMNKHNMELEDMLEEWSEMRSEEKDIKAQFREYEQGESRLLELFDAYQEQIWNLKRFAEMKDEAWSAQISLMEKNLEHHRKLCGISIIGEYERVEVDYDLHEVIETVDTGEQDKDKQIVRMYSSGYIYKGVVKKKAKVAAYHYVGNAENK